MGEKKPTVSYHSGFDIFTPDAGTRTAMYCIACGYEMSVARGVPYSGRRWAASKDSELPNPRIVDKFTCDNAGQDWHDQVIVLKRLQRDLPSRILSDLIEPEIGQIITTKTPTKSNWGINYGI